MPGKGTDRTSFRLPVETLTQLDRLCDWYGGLDRTSTLKLMIAEKYREAFPPQEKISRKTSKVS